ncbi:MAG: efflux RND transporter periplasmic adaptor subunit [Bacteroidales bacterium]|nr:efflux RND transporter periplasmic adaptor subunit [Bacteroidales bacterium]
MNKRKLIINGAIIVVILILAVILMNVMVSSHTDPEMVPSETKKIYVKAKKIIYLDVTENIVATGRLASQHDVDVSSEVQGQILVGNVKLKEGQSFKKGDLLIRIFDEEARNNLKAQKSRFLNSIAGILPDIKIDYNTAFDKWLGFFNSIDILKPLPPLPQFDSDKEKIFLASRNILNDYYTIQSSQVRLAKYSIYTPFSGSITHVYLEVGSVANPGSRIAKLIRTDKLELEVPVEVENIYWLKEGTEVLVTTDDSQRSWNGRVVRIADYVDPATQSITVFVELNSSPGNMLYQGQYLQAHFSTEKMENVMELTRSSVFDNNKVYVIQEGKLKIEEIDIIRISHNTVYFSGLPDTLYVVAEPLVNVKEGMPVEILK